MRRAALTLLEVLAVSVLLGVIAIALSPVVGRRQVDPLDAFIAAVRVADADLRQRALGQGAVWQHRGDAVIGQIGTSRDAAVVVPLPAALSCTWTVGPRTVDRLVIDAYGRSADAIWEVRTQRGVRRLACDGLVGGWRVLDSP